MEYIKYKYISCIHRFWQRFIFMYSNNSICYSNFVLMIEIWITNKTKQIYEIWFTWEIHSDMKHRNCSYISCLTINIEFQCPYSRELTLSSIPCTAVRHIKTYSSLKVITRIWLKALNENGFSIWNSQCLQNYDVGSKSYYVTVLPHR